MKYFIIMGSDLKQNPSNPYSRKSVPFHTYQHLRTRQVIKQVNQLHMLIIKMKLRFQNQQS